MIKEYLFKIIKEQYITVSATNKHDAYEIAEENSYIDTSNEEIIDVELVDVYDADEDAIYDDYKLDMYNNDESRDDDYDESKIDKYFYGC